MEEEWSVSRGSVVQVRELFSETKERACLSTRRACCILSSSDSVFRQATVICSSWPCRSGEHKKCGENVGRWNFLESQPGSNGPLGASNVPRDSPRTRRDLS